MYKIIGLAKEVESPENPGALEQRVALIPADVKNSLTQDLLCLLKKMPVLE